VTVTIETEFALPGDVVSVPVSISPGEEVVATRMRNDIAFDPLTAIQIVGDDQPDCTPSASVSAERAFFLLISTPDGRPAGLRAIVTDGPALEGLLYRCNFAVSPAAPPGAYPLRISQVQVNGMSALGLDGAIVVVTPTPTTTDTPTITPTPTVTPTATVTPTMPTPTPTATRTPTQTGTPTSTATQTPIPSLAVEVVGSAARPGGGAAVSVNLLDDEERLAELQFDVIVDAAVFDLAMAARQCAKDPRVSMHQFSAVAPQGQSRLRFAFFDLQLPLDLLGAGRLLKCDLPVKPDAPLGATQLTLDQVLPADRNGVVVPGVVRVDGEVIVDPEALTPTSTATLSDTPTPTATAPATATDTELPTSTPSPSPTPQIGCVGDCDGDGEVDVSELIQAVNIALGNSSVETCTAADRSGDGAVTVDELVAAVDNALTGCAA
jgi:hypothetical protein